MQKIRELLCSTDTTTDPANFPVPALPVELQRSDYVYATPANDIGRAFAGWFGHGWDFITAPTPEPGQKPRYRTEDRYPLTGAQLWERWQDPLDIIGVRFGNSTRYALIDLDVTGPYADAWEPVIHALEDKAGLAGFVPVQSSYSGGKHLYIPLPKSVSTWHLAVVIHWALETSGLTLQDGRLETFPNTKQWDSKYKAHALPLQPGRGSVMLSKSGEPVSQMPSDWLRAMTQESDQQDMSRFKAAVKKAKKWWRRRKLKRDRHGESTFNAFRADLEWEIEQGWTGAAQSNRLIYVAMKYAFICKRKAGNDLVEWALEKIPTIPGFDRWCKTKGAALEKWIRAKAKIVEEKYFMPNFGRTTKPPGPSKNDALRDAKRAAIASAMEQIEQSGEVPDGIIALQQRIEELSGASLKTCYKHKDLWHPKYRKLSNPPSDEVSSPSESDLEGEGGDTPVTPESPTDGEICTPAPLMKGIRHEFGSKNLFGSERSAPTFQPPPPRPPSTAHLPPSNPLRQQIHRLRSQYAAADALGDSTRAAKIRLEIESLGVAAATALHPDFNVLALGAVAGEATTQARMSGFP